MMVKKLKTKTTDANIWEGTTIPFFLSIKNKLSPTSMEFRAVCNNMRLPASLPVNMNWSISKSGAPTKKESRIAATSMTIAANILPALYFSNESLDLSKNKAVPDSTKTVAVSGFIGEKEAMILLKKTMSKVHPSSTKNPIRIIRLFNTNNVL